MYINWILLYMVIAPRKAGVPYYRVEMMMSRDQLSETDTVLMLVIESFETLSILYCRLCEYQGIVSISKNKQNTI